MTPTHLRMIGFLEAYLFWFYLSLCISVIIITTMVIWCGMQA